MLFIFEYITCNLLTLQYLLQACCNACAENVENKVLCKLTLTDEDLVRLRDAIEDLYYFEFVIGWCLLCAFSSHCYFIKFCR